MKTKIKNQQKQEANSLHSLVLKVNQKAIGGTSHWIQMGRPVSSIKYLMSF